jgi:hypothetical protein
MHWKARTEMALMLQDRTYEQVLSAQRTTRQFGDRVLDVPNPAWTALHQERIRRDQLKAALARSEGGFRRAPREMLWKGNIWETIAAWLRGDDLRAASAA